MLVSLNRYMLARLTIARRLVQTLTIAMTPTTDT